jgi:hypothetical protein
MSEEWKSSAPIPKGARMPQGHWYGPEKGYDGPSFAAGLEAGRQEARELADASRHLLVAHEAGQFVTMQIKTLAAALKKWEGAK